MFLHVVNESCSVAFLLDSAGFLFLICATDVHYITFHFLIAFPGKNSAVSNLESVFHVCCKRPGHEENHIC